MTAYLKAHYPVEFMAALLSSDITGPQLQAEGFAGRAHRRLPADGHHGAAAGREPLGRRVHRGRGQDLLRAVGHQGLRRRRRPARSPPSAAARGPYRSLFDFCERLDPGTVNRTAVESLIKAGAFDSLGGTPGAIVRGDRSGHAGRGRRRHRPPQRPDGPVRRRRRRPARDRLDQPARRARVGRTRAAGQGEGSAGLLPVEPSAGRARRRRWPPTARTPRSRRPS